MEPGDRVIGRTAYRVREPVASTVRCVARVTPGERLRLTSGALERAEYWRVATPAEAAAWDARTAARAAADAVAGHMAACPSLSSWGPQRADDVRQRAAAALAWAGRLAELHAQLEAAMGAAAVALESRQPPSASPAG